MRQSRLHTMQATAPTMNQVSGVREGCASFAGEETTPIPDDRFHSAEVGTIHTFKEGQYSLFELVGGEIIRFRIGVNQASIRRKNFGASEQAFATHILRHP